MTASTVLLTIPLADGVRRLAATGFLRAVDAFEAVVFFFGVVLEELEVFFDPDLTAEEVFFAEDFAPPVDVRFEVDLLPVEVFFAVDFDRPLVVVLFADDFDLLADALIPDFPPVVFFAVDFAPPLEVFFVDDFEPPLDVFFADDFAPPLEVFFVDVFAALDDFLAVLLPPALAAFFEGALLLPDVLDVDFDLDAPPFAAAFFDGAFAAVFFFLVAI